MPLPFQPKYLYRPRTRAPMPTRMGFAGDADNFRLRRLGAFGVGSFWDDAQKAVKTVQGGIEKAGEIGSQIKETYEDIQAGYENIRDELTGGNAAPPDYQPDYQPAPPDYQPAPPPPNVMNPMPAPPIDPYTGIRFQMVQTPYGVIKAATPGTAEYAAAQKAAQQKQLLILGGVAAAAFVLFKFVL